MTDLTEKLKKGELPAGEYYIKYYYGETTSGVYLGNSWENMFDNDEVVEVLAPVPSYEEYQKLLSDQLAKIEGEEIVAELEAENAKLKNLLKECVPYVNHGFMETREFLTKPYTASDRVLHKKAEKLLTKIDEVLR